MPDPTDHTETEVCGEKTSSAEDSENARDEGKNNSAEHTTENAIDGSATDNRVGFELIYNVVQDRDGGILTWGDRTTIHIRWLDDRRIIRGFDQIIVTCSEHLNILNILDIIREDLSFPIILVEKVNLVNIYFQERCKIFQER